MRKSQKAMITFGTLAVIAVCTVAPTLSWLSDTSDPVVNKFAGGAISIKLDEALVNTDGQALTGEYAQRVTNNSYKYVPGAVLDKDPTPTVLKGSEECYVFICVENELTDKFSINYDTNSWLQVATADNQTVYVYSQKINAKNSEEDVVLNPIFTKVTVSTELTSSDIKALGEKNLTATAYAVQAKSIDKNTAIDLAAAQFLPEGTNTQYPDIA
ncbi:hypothetical protein [Ruminococcus sp.]|uniref:hypothetical protein n=1 Tax=Ruminococcus sp. TaxID=41978 RepID=UPI00386A9910